jgi:hypothetical protein
MSVADLVKRASEHIPAKRYDGDEDKVITCRVTLTMMRDMDHVAAFTGVSRSDLMRSILTDALPGAYDLCESVGTNARGQTFASLRPRYYEDLSPHDQALADAYEESR